MVTLTPFVVVDLVMVNLHDNNDPFAHDCFCDLFLYSMASQVQYCSIAMASEVQVTLCVSMKDSNHGQTQLQQSYGEGGSSLDCGGLI